MKRLILTLFAAFSLSIAGPLALSGCSGIDSIVQKVPDGPNAKIAAALTAVTTARELLTTAVNSDKITAVDAENLRSQINTARAGIDVAQAAFKADPAGGDARLAAARAAIDGVRNYLILKGAKP